MREQIIFAAAVFALLIVQVNAALPPSDFNQRLDNLKALYGQPTDPNAFIINPEQHPENPEYNVPKLIPAYWAVVDEMKAEYSLAYAGRDSNDHEAQARHYRNLMELFAKLQPLVPEFSLEPLRLEVMDEFGFIPTSTPVPYKPVQIYQGPAPTVIIKNSQPESTANPTASPKDGKRQSVLSAMKEVLWENSLMIAVFIIGILVVYALYHKDEDSEQLTEQEMKRLDKFDQS